jgi:glycosyltransferase involved in cell wall biosynthesis
MRIAFFSETFLPKVDGIVTRLRNTILQLRKAGDEVLIFAPFGGIEDFEGARVVGMPSVPFPLYPELRLSLPRSSIRRTLLEFNPDIIHAVDPALLGIAGIYYASILRVPLVVSYHTQLPRYLNYYKIGFLEGLVWKLLRLRHKSAVLNLCTSAAMVDELTRHGIPRVELWQRGIDTDLFSPERASGEMREYLSQGNPRAPLLLYVGRISPEKNIEQLRQLLVGIPEARLAIVGGGPHRNALEKHFQGSPTFFPGYMQGEGLASAFASADLFVLPSRTETLGLVLLEAMAAGCPVIGARAGGIPDIVEDGVTGFLFDEEQEAIRAAQLLIADPARREQIRQKALHEARKWGWTEATGQLRMFYRQVMATAATSPFRTVNVSREPLVSRLAKAAAMGVIRRVLR